MIANPEIITQQHKCLTTGSNKTQKEGDYDQEI